MSDDLTCREDIPTSLFDDIDNAKAPEKRNVNVGNPVLLSSTSTPTSSGTPSVIRIQSDSRITLNRNNDNTFTTFRKPTFSHMTRHGVIPPVVMPRTIPRESGSENGLELRPSQIQQSNNSFSATIKPLGNNAAPFFPPKREFDSRQVLNRNISGGMTIQNPLQSSGQHVTTVIQPTSKIYKTVNDGQGRTITRVNVPSISRITHIATNPQVTRTVIPIRQPAGGQIARPNILRATKIQATTARALQQKTPSTSDQNTISTDSKANEVGLIKSIDQKCDPKMETKTVLHAADIRNSNSQVLTPQSTVIISCGLPGTQLSQQIPATPVIRKRGRKQEILKDDNCPIGPPVTNIVVANPIIVKPVLSDTPQQNEGEPKTRRRGGGRKKKADADSTTVKEPPKKRGRKNETVAEKAIEFEESSVTKCLTLDVTSPQDGKTKDDRIQESIDALFSSPVPTFLENLNGSGSGQNAIETGKKGKGTKTPRTPRVPKQQKTPKVPKETKKEKEQNDNKEVKITKPTRSRKTANDNKANLLTQTILSATNEKKVTTTKSPSNSRSVGKTVQLKGDSKLKEQEILKNNIQTNEIDGKKRLTQINSHNNSSSQVSKTTSLKDLRVMQLLQDHKVTELTKNSKKEDIDKNDKKGNKKVVKPAMNNNKKVNEIIRDNGENKEDDTMVKGKLNDKVSSVSSSDGKSTTNLNGCGKNVQFKNESTFFNLSTKPSSTITISQSPLRGILKNKPILSEVMKKIKQNNKIVVNPPSAVTIKPIVPEPAVPGPSNVKIIEPVPSTNDNFKVPQILKVKEKEKTLPSESVVKGSQGPIKPPPAVAGPSGIGKSTTSLPQETSQKTLSLEDKNTYGNLPKKIIQQLLKELSKKSAAEKLEYLRTLGLYNKMADVEKNAVQILCHISKETESTVNVDPNYIVEMKKKCEEKLKEIAQVERDDMSALQKNLLQKLKNQKLINHSKNKSKKGIDEEGQQLPGVKKSINKSKGIRKNDSDIKNGNDLKFDERKLREIMMYSDSKEEIAENVLKETFKNVMNGRKSTFFGGFSISKHCKVKADKKIKPRLSKSFIRKRNIIRAKKCMKNIVTKKEKEATIAKADCSLQTTQNNSLFRHKRLNMTYDECYTSKPYSVAEARFIKKYKLSETFRYIDSHQVKRLMLDFFRKIDSPLKYSKRAFFYQLLKSKKIFGETKIAKERMKIVIEHINKKLIETKQKPFSLLNRCEILKSTPGIYKYIFKPFNIFSSRRRKQMKCPSIKNWIINSKIIHGMAWEHIGSLFPLRKKGLVSDINKLKQIMPVDKNLINLYEGHVLVGFEKYKPTPSTYYKAVYPILHPEVTKLFTLVDEDIDPNISKVYKNGRCYNVPGDDFFYAHGSIKERETPQYPQLNEFASPTLGIKLDEDFEKLQNKIKNLLSNKDVERVKNLSNEEVVKTYELNKRSFEGTWLHNTWGTLAHWGEVVAGACVKADVAEAEALKTWLNAC